MTGTTDRVPEQRGAPLLDIAVRYAEERLWDVFPGTWLEVEEGTSRELCSCASAALCPTPGAHPAHRDWAGQATGNAAAVRRLWAKQPRAAILLPTGRSFDALDVPVAAGCLALARMERLDLEVGPVSCTPLGRMLFLVLPGSAAKVPDLVRRLGWVPGSLGLTARGEGDWLAAPPTRYGTRGQVQWVRPPTPANQWLPDVEQLISPLAYACTREKEKEGVQRAPRTAPGPGRVPRPAARSGGRA